MWVIIGTDDFSIINQGFAGEVDIMEVLGVLLRASVAEVHGQPARKGGCGKSYICLVMEFTVSFITRKLVNEAGLIFYFLFSLVMYCC